MARIPLILLIFLVAKISAAPADMAISLVVSSTEASTSETNENESTEVSPTVPKIYQMHVTSSISNRFAHTTITSKVKNSASKAQEATFSVVLPETAFISGFIMEVDGKNYTAYVKEKEEAKRDYDQAVASGLGAAHVAVSARDSNRFTVSVNIEPEKKAAFYLTYEQLLKREDSHYEQVINLHPGQPVKDLSVEVVINESRKITDLKAPPLRSGNEIGNDKAELDPRADIKHVNDTSAVVKFTPNLERQKQLASLLGAKEDEGLSGQFVVQYDVERDPKGGEVLIQDGYFVHFFAPSELEPLPKHVVFVLDTSGSMYGDKIKQLREAMHKILEQLHDDDVFSLVEFNSNVKVWNLDNLNSSIWFPRHVLSDPCAWTVGPEESEVSFSYYKFPNAYLANSDNIKKAKDAVSKLVATGGTDIYSALRVGLHLIESAKSSDNKHQPMIMFLTDGEPTVREKSRDAITKKITEFNSDERKSPIFSLSFGEGADKDFLQKLALRNSGFNRHIYEAADASLQLQDFYNQISSPLLSDVTFKYEPSITSLTKTEFPIHFGGSELVVAGWCGTDNLKPPIVNAHGVHGDVILVSSVQESVSNIERLWAYLTVQQLLEKKDASDKDQEELTKKALDIALKYSFVTPISSLVVVKPNATSAVNTENAATGAYAESFVGGFGGASPGIPGVAGVPQSIVPISGGAAASSFPSATPIPHFPPPNIQFTTVSPSIQFTTPFCPPLFYTTFRKSEVVFVLPWLKDILKENDVLKLPSGEYKLGMNETISEDVACPKTPLNGPGQCKLLKSCPHIHSLLVSSDVFVNHFCVLKEEFAGVCCPDYLGMSN